MTQDTFRSISITDTAGTQTEAAEALVDVFFRYEPLENGYACYVSAEYEKGFSHSEAVRFSVNRADTSDFLAIENHSPYWCRPFWGDSLSALPKRTQELLIRDGNRYICYLPVVADTYKTLIRGTDGGFEFFMYSNVSGLREIDDQLSFLCMEGTDPMKLLDDIATAAASLLGNGLKMRGERTVAPLFDYLGWCSWDALQIRINHEDMLKKAREFKEKGVPIGFAIYDDMWADAPLLEYVPHGDGYSRKTMVRIMHASMLRSFEGDPKRFPKGMKAAIADLKKEGIPYVGVWFPTTGYWSGLQPGGEIAGALRDVTVLSEEKRQIIAAPDAKKATEYFDTLCARTRNWGADFVKIDNQGYHDRYMNLAPIGRSAHAIQTAIDAATEKHFSGALINCMGMPSECMFNRPTSAISRCSDDFMPESRAWFAKNILQCSYNGLLQGKYYVNDWDMWWTDDEQAARNSLCRAVSGGPIYISDEIGRTRPEVLRPLILKDGRILRCDESATPTPDCLMQNPTKTDSIFKIRNRTGKNAVAAVFNINEENKAVHGTLSAKELGLPKGDYVYYEFFSKACGVLSDGVSVEITLDSNDHFRLYTLLPKEEAFTVIGRTDLFIGAKAVTSVCQQRVTLVEGGEVSIYSESPIRILAGDAPVPAEKTGNLYRITLPPEETEIEVVL